MAVGATFGALNTMYSSVSSRTREIATLRAVGFKSAPIVIAILAEALILALAGGTGGGLIAWAAFDGFKAATINWQSFSQVAFAFDVTPALLAQGVLNATLARRLTPLGDLAARPLPTRRAWTVSKRP